MPLEPINLSPLSDAMTRFQREWSDFARLWQDTKADWRDERAREFEREQLEPLGPSLSRFAASLSELTETLRKAQIEVADTDRQSSELY